MQYYYFENIMWDKYYASGILDFTKINNEVIRCPKCGFSNRFKLYPPFKLELSSAKFGDIVHSDNLDFIVSEKFKNLYEKSNLQGIEEFTPIDKVIVKRNKNKLQHPKYYFARLKWIRANYDKEFTIIQNSSEAFAKTEHHCEVCDTLGRRDIDGYRIKINEPGDYDIFIPFEIVKDILMSQRFVDWCLENEITNVKAKFTKTEDHICPLFYSSVKEQVEMTNEDLKKRLSKFGEY